MGNYNGTLVNGATYGTGIINQGFSLDGVNDYVTVGNLFNVNGTEARTYTCWIKSNSVTGQGIILSSSSGSPYDGLTFFRENNKIRFQLVSSSGQFLIFYSTSTLLINTWYNVSITYDGSRLISGCKLYINGVSDVLFSASSNLTSSTLTLNTSTIGARSAGQFPFNGLIDEVSVFNRVLSPTEVTELYNSGLGKQYPN